MTTARPSRLVLGTVQFGLAYGATNTGGQVSETEAANILSAAEDAGIGTLDTAPAYGGSEAVLGRLGAGRNFAVITKTAALPSRCNAAEAARRLDEGLTRSLKSLRLSTVDGLLLHQSNLLGTPLAATIIEFLHAARADGRARRIGVSVYEGAAIDHALALFTPDIVQLPYNLLDQRMARFGHLVKLKARGVEVHARSLFLQGALLADPDKLPPPVAHAPAAFAAIAATARQHGLSRIALALAVGFANLQIDRLVLGVTARSELDEILAAVRSLPAALPDLTALAIDDATILDPSRWPPPSRS